MQFPSEIKQFLQQPHYMTLGTLNSNNTIQMSVVWYEFKNDTFQVSTTTDRAKYKNMQQNPQVTFLIYDIKNPYRYIQVQGTVTFSKEGAHDFIDHLSEIYMGQKKYPGDPQRKQDRVIVTITPTRFSQMGF